MREIIVLVIIIVVIISFCNNNKEERDPNDYNPYSRHKLACNCTSKFDDGVLQLRTPGKEEEALLDEIIRFEMVSPQTYHLCKTREIPGNGIAYATHINGKRYIIYEQAYFSRISKIAKAGVLGHEMGHHAANHILDHSRLDNVQELEADYYIGVVLHRLGYDLDESVNTITPDIDGHGIYAPSNVRRHHIKKGWEDTDKLYPRHTVQEQTAPQTTDTRQLVSTLDETTEVIPVGVRVITAFIKALGEQDFYKAYDLQCNASWGNYDLFKSARSFGGITDTKILDEPKPVPCTDKYGNACEEDKFYIRYFARDMINDGHKKGKIYEQYIWVIKKDEAYRIKDVETLSIKDNE